MPKLYKVVVTTQTAREVSVVAETPEEAQAKASVQPGEAVVEVAELGEVVV